LRYGENMYMGKRIAIEIKNALKQKKPQAVLA
jgi:5-formaminoimidazole-4-carboxamide-1-beta-D-ribofuranosyl 5'-monophosphate synthetase